MPAMVFVTLNVVDAYLTKIGLTAGALEINPLMTVIGGNMLAKGLLAAALVFVLYFFSKEKVLWPVNFLLFGIVLWNSATCWIVNVM